jgi:hypothetical protein
MNQPAIADEVHFHADLVAAQEEEFTPDYSVHGIYFGEGDPEQGGQHWNFTRSLDDDNGVCIVKEPQEIVIYGGIVRVSLARHNLMCQFSEAAAQSTKVRTLLITFTIDGERWNALVEQALQVFDGESSFLLVP